MPHSLPSFHIMPVGWDHTAWQGQFYPEDLPEDWRLSYFANEFSEVLVPQIAWIEAGADQLQSWADDVSEGFRFFLAISDPVTPSLYVKQADVLSDNLGGFVVTQDAGGQGWWEAFLAINQQWRVPLFKAIETSIFEPLQSFSQGAGMGVAFLFASSDFGDLAATRGFFEQLQHKVEPDTQILLCLDGNPPSFERMIQIRQLAQLMGLA